MNKAFPHLAAFACLALLLAFSWLGKTALERYKLDQKENPYTHLARQLNAYRVREFCDGEQAKRRIYVTSVVDRFRAQLQGLWGERGTGGEPRFAVIDLGVAKLRVSPRTVPQEGFDSSAWSWDEAYGLIQRTQADPGSPENKERWRDVDSMVKFLLEKDLSRQVYGKKFLPPDLTQHQFRPNPDVRRTGARELTVTIDSGDFRPHEDTLRKILEAEWQGQGWKVRVRWAQGAYRMLAHSDSSRSFVNHRKRTMEIANLAWTKTVAHELGHILGFDDHYYNVWNGRNCYYTQESRLADIMSNSEKGGLTARHWEILDRAYPWKAQGPKEVFSYTYGK
jgi:hypothetical protein